MPNPFARENDSRSITLKRIAIAWREHKTELDLSGIGIKKLPEEIKNLNRLEFINLENNQLQAIPEVLGALPNLRHVNVCNNPIKSLSAFPGIYFFIDSEIFLRFLDDLSPETFQLQLDIELVEKKGSPWLAILRQSCIQSLYIRQRVFTTKENGNREMGQAIVSILSSIGTIDTLKTLRIYSQDIKKLPEGIQYLQNLEVLELLLPSLQTIPEWIGNLRLKSLYLLCDQLSDLPETLSNLKELKFLKLQSNTLKSIPTPVFDLPSLASLVISHSREISEVPADILRLDKLNYFDLDCLSVKKSPPYEITRKGLEAIRDYWRQRLDNGVDYLCEAKLIILGEAGAGKTSLAQKLKNPNYRLSPYQNSTEGIDVIQYQYPTSIRTRDEALQKLIEREFRVNIWDFGGQEIYHATHQFFLTRRSVYVLVCDDRKEDTDFYYWLQVVEMLSDASPLLIVQNEKQNRKRDINFSGLRGRFCNLQNALSTNLDTNQGLDLVTQAIRKELEDLPHVGVGLPSSWKWVRETLEQDNRDYISLADFLDICQQHGFSRHGDKLQLSGYLHDLGICLHFQDDPLLKNIVILKPSWGTDAVYRVLDDAEVMAAHGHFNRSQLTRIWSDSKYMGMQDELLRLMMKFQLCYSLDGDQSFIAPQLLSPDQPSYAWRPECDLVVRYEYDFMPKGIVTRLIVALHHLIAGGTLVWKTGVLLERDGTRAEIVEYYHNRRIRVRVSGPGHSGLFAIVDEQLERLHATFSRLKYERYLPCPCPECQATAEPYGFALAQLVKMAQKNKPIQCHNSGEMINSDVLLRDVLPAAVPLGSNFDGVYSARSMPRESMQLDSAYAEVFVSYAWTTESCTLVDRLQLVLKEHGIPLLRDREEVRYKDSIRAFMRRLGTGKAVVLVISADYLKSENCMFELIEVAKSEGLRERIFPILLSDANLFKATGRIGYIQHWEQQIQALDESLKTVRADNLSSLHDDLNIYCEIRHMFDRIADILRDMNVLTSDQHEDTDFEELIRRLKAQIGV
jgi:internalin A